MCIPLSQAFPNVGIPFKQPHAEQQQFIEIQQIAFTQLSLIGFGNFSQTRVIHWRLDISLPMAERDHLVQLPLGGGSRIRLTQSPQGPLHDRDLSTAISHAEVWWQVESMSFRFQQLETKAMESSQEHPVRL